MITAFLFPFLYCVLLGWAWSRTFRRKFYSSLAPAILLHTFLVLIAGLTIQKLSYGVYFGLLVFGGALILSFLKLRRFNLRDELSELWNNGLWIFLIFYLFCFVSNINKRFYSWDEFSHWGMFLKESLRTNRLYCTSPLRFSHKDYVPEITLFEVIWCKLIRQYSEANIYRCIQTFMFCFLMPMFECFDKHLVDHNDNKEKTGIGKRLSRKLPVMGGLLLVMLVPMIFHQGNGFLFYHSIYCDFTVGILTFYALFCTYNEYDDLKYQIFILTLAFSGLTLSKMTSMAIMPMIAVFFFVKQLLIAEGKNHKKYAFSVIIPFVGSAGIWFVFNRFVDRYVSNTGGIQSYDGMKISSILEVFSDPKNSSISYLEDVRRTYINALFSRDILIHGSYAVALACIVIIVIILARYQNGISKKKTYLASLWMLLAGIAYALLMYFLYETAFSEREARNLASYERYMNSFIVAILMMALAIYFASGVWKYYSKGYGILISVICLDLFFLHITYFKQIVPGTFTHDGEKTLSAETSAADVQYSTPENASIYVVTRGDNRDTMFKMRYFCFPRMVDGVSVGPPVDAADVYSNNMSVESFISTLKDFDYLYLNKLDQEFVEKYSVAFKDASHLSHHTLFKVEKENDEVVDLKYVYSRTNELEEITVLDEYLEALKESGYDVFMSIKDNGTQFLTQERLGLLEDLGINTDLLKSDGVSFLAVIEDGKVIEAESGDDTISNTGKLETTNTEYSITSGGAGSSNISSSIVINGKEYSLNNRGLNIVVYDPQSNVIVDSTAFDTFIGSLCYR